MYLLSDTDQSHGRLAEEGEEKMEDTQAVRVEVAGWHDDVLKVVEVSSKAELAKVLNDWLDHEGVASVTVTKSNSAVLV